MSEGHGGTYRTSAAPTLLESTCLLCGSDGEADKTCWSCAVAMPRITCACGEINGMAATRCRACGTNLAEPKRTRGCPRCRSALTEIAVDPSASVHACTGCRALFVPARAWHLLSVREDLTAALASRLAPPATAPPETRLYDCPECGSEMERMRFAATSHVVVNACPRHDGILLDQAALAPALAYAKHRRVIGAEAAAREADAIERSRPGGDPHKRRHEAALAVARERQERAAMAGFEAPLAPQGKRHYTLIAVLGLMGLFYLSLSAKDCSKHGRTRRGDGPDTDVKALQSQP